MWDILRLNVYTRLKKSRCIKWSNDSGIHFHSFEDPEKLAEQVRENLSQNSEAFQELLRRAMKNGGSLQLDMKEFQGLMKENGGSGKALTPGEFERMMGKDWMERLGRNAEEIDDGDEADYTFNEINQFMV